VIELYPQIKLVHMTSVASSGLLFLLRAVGAQLHGKWAMAAGVRYLSYTIDTVLLTSALMLMTVLHQYPGVQAWLTVKVSLVVLYIVLGSFALKRGKTQATRLAYTLAALLVFAFIVSIAVTHHPLGVFSLWA
jgi:uncharacterized membrane protein SirB2